MQFAFIGVWQLTFMKYHHVSSIAVFFHCYIAENALQFIFGPVEELLVLLFLLLRSEIGRTKKVAASCDTVCFVGLLHMQIYHFLAD